MNHRKTTRTLRPTQAARIELHHLRSAIAAADHGSFRAAAESTAVRHSALSRSVKSFEHLLGATLFIRSSAGLRATSTGRNVLRIAKLILEQVEVLATMGDPSAEAGGGKLSIGFYTSMSAGNLRASLLEFKRRFPEIELATVERSRTRLIHALRTGTLDAIIMTGAIPFPADEKLSLWSERILVSVPEGHRLADREAVFWTDLRDETLILSHYDPGAEFEDLLISKLVSLEHRPRIERHDVSRGIIKSLVTMGLGLSLVTESDVGAKFAGLIYRELRDGSGPSRIGFSASWRRDNENIALKHFLALLTERYPPPAPD